MKPYQIHLLYFYYGRIKTIQLITSYCCKRGMDVKDICFSLLHANREINFIRKELNDNRR